MEDLDVKVCKEATTCEISAIRCPRPTKPSTTDAGDPKPKKRRSRLEAIARHRDAAIAHGRNDRRDDEGHGWQQHSVRGFLAGVVRKRLKLKLSSKKVDGNRVYQIASGNAASPPLASAKRRAA